MTFAVSADAYARFMGRFSEPLADQFVELGRLRTGDRALDVGSGPGALTGRLVDRLGEDSVCAVDPSPTFVAALKQRFPGVDVQVGVAEELPFASDSFDAVFAQLVVHFMTDPVSGIAQMRRVARAGGRLAVNVWDHSAGGTGPLSVFWQAVHDTDPGAGDESSLPGTRKGQLEGLCFSAGLTDITSTVLTVTSEFSSFEEWWLPYTLGVGPAGSYVASLDDQRVHVLRARCRQLLPPAPFEISATAWCVTAQT